MSAIMISIRPEHNANILNGLKTIEVRTSCPKEWRDYLSGKTKERPKPITVYDYCTKSKRYLYRVNDDDEFETTNKIRYVDDNYVKDYHAQNGKVCVEFTLEEIDKFQVFENGSVQNWNGDNLEKSCLTYDELANYVGKGKTGYAWHISNLKIYDKPKELSEFKSWQRDRDGWQCTEKEANKWLTLTLQSVKRAPQSWGYVEELEH